MSWLRVQLGKIWLRNDISPEQYISLLWNGQFHFSKTYNRSTVSSPYDLNHTIFLPLEDKDIPNILLLQLWQNHMILYQHQVNVIELKTRPAIRRLLQIKTGDVLEFWIAVIREDEIIIGNEPVGHPHFMLIQHISSIVHMTPDKGPSYFAVKNQQGTINIPVLNAVCSIGLPFEFKLQHFKNGYFYSQTQLLTAQKIDKKDKILTLTTKLDIEEQIKVLFQWITIKESPKLLSYTLFDACDFLLYDIDIKLEQKQGIREGLKLKVVSGHRSYELGGQLELGKLIKIARLVFFVIKSEGQDFSFVLQRKNRIVSKVIICSDEIINFKCNAIKKDILQPLSAKHIGVLKFKAQKGRGISPFNNTLWSSNYQKKLQCSLVQISQLSLLSELDCKRIILRTEDQQHLIQDIPNFSMFSLQTQLPPPLQLKLNKNTNIYLKLTSSGDNDKDVVGMAVIDPKQLRFGPSPIRLKFFKQQTLICQGRALINKIYPWPLSKRLPNVDSNFLLQKTSQISLSVILRGVQLTSIYWSYLYDGRSDFYCIIELNRVKKVLVLQKATNSQRLFFLPDSGSDILNYVVQKTESINLKITILATDCGIQQQIYGSLSRNIRSQDIMQNPCVANEQKIMNMYNTIVGTVDFDLQIGLLGEYKKPIKHDLNQIKGDLQKINKSIQKVEQYRSSPQAKKKQYRQASKSLVLPKIKDPRQERLLRLAKMLQYRAKPKKKTQNVKNKLHEQKAITDQPKLPFIQSNPKLTQDIQGRYKDTPIEIQLNQNQDNQFLADIAQNSPIEQI